jgi:hypothetical protein
MTNFATFQTLLQQVCSMLNLAVPSDPVGSTDPNLIMMRTAANLASLEMLNAYEWSQLTKMGEIIVEAPPPVLPGEAVEVAFDMPGDFYRFIDQTQWNGAMRFPAVGPVAPQGWMTYMVFADVADPPEPDLLPEPGAAARAAVPVHVPVPGAGAGR